MRGTLEQDHFIPKQSKSKPKAKFKLEPFKQFVSQEKQTKIDSVLIPTAITEKLRLKQPMIVTSFFSKDVIVRQSKWLLGVLMYKISIYAE